jgi:hypothetical protein
MPRAALPAATEIELSLPFTGLWLVRNSPAQRIPSHGTDLLGERYAIDFIGTDDRRRTARTRDWRTLFATEPSERFLGFGRPILAPASRIVEAVHDAETDHEARRSPLALVPYAAGQASRLRRGLGEIAGNYVIISLERSDAFVALVHLRTGSVTVAAGERVVDGQQIAGCGNSGNSTQPHLHLQVMDSADLSVARGLPMMFGRFRERPRGATLPQVRQRGIPGERSVVEPWQPPPNARPHGS